MLLRRGGPRLAVQIGRSRRSLRGLEVVPVLRISILVGVGLRQLLSPRPQRSTRRVITTTNRAASLARRPSVCPQSRYCCGGSGDGRGTDNTALFGGSNA